MMSPTAMTAEHFGDHARRILGQEPHGRALDPATPPVRGDHDLNANVDVPDLDEPIRPAAVLVPIVPRGGGLQVLLTLRAAHLPTHAGQVAFPGGEVEPHDPSALETALREAEEEIGLVRDCITPLGYLDSYQTGTGFRVLPVVALVEPGFSLVIDPSEVADTFEVPLAFLMDPANHQRHSIEWKGATRYYYAMPWEDRYIWGATAGILRNLQETLFKR
ncbi:MAG: CoA pyrophosphatase [Hyphomicrobiaceae bacterium]